MVLIEIVYCHNALQEILPAFSLPDSQLLFVFFFWWLLFLQICPFPLQINNSTSNTTAKTVCKDCDKLYQNLEESYKDLTNSDSIEYKVCGDVSASVSIILLDYCVSNTAPK